MSMLSKWTIGAIASKKASASLPVGAADALGEAGGGERAGGDDGQALGGELIDPLADDGDVRVGRPARR